MYVLEYARKNLRGHIINLHGQSPVCATGPKPAAEASVLCDSDAYILQLFSEPSSPLLAFWVQF